ncbi:glucose 1-dehydrogenase [Brucella pseudogrignonensis]|uniref:glucose 1-dehydrogenase n=1 Tax=Brucella pseudogrignonensis TaxID=419475 RepID=UPI001E43B982|nr:glucose 1-dehydrogenase [Brucella pseudogrignonensis]MCD4512025.1 glucose 1-dehydrogenase [Brucella pseudogrignonensis]
MTKPTYDFTGQVALVTGPSSGMGLATAEAFARAGAAVVLAANHVDGVTAAAERLMSQGYKALGITCDVADEAQVAAMVEQTVATFGRLDMAYNNAGIQAPPTDAAEESAHQYDRVTDIDLRGIWASMKHELLQMRKQCSGVIVNCSSIGGLIGLPGRAAYHASKHGVIGLTRSAALEYAPRGIRINAICPGTFNTPMVAKMLREEPNEMADIMKSQPIGRLGEPEEVADAVLWLCSDASSFVLGVALPVDGGYTAH